MEWRGFSQIHSDQDESNACDILTAKAQGRRGKNKREKKPRMARIKEN